MAYTFLNFALDVLNKSEVPLDHYQIWEVGVEKGLDKQLNSKGKTPWRTLGAQLYVEVRDNPSSQFIKVGKRPTKFFLKGKEYKTEQEKPEIPEKSKGKKVETSSTYHERELHAVLTYYANSQLFKQGKSIYTKTIYHEKSPKNGYNQWVYPDIVGFYIPIEEWSNDVIELNRISDNNSLQLYSFEMKKELSRNNYRESFFQAVSNSSWAHEGYLVTAEIDEDDELIAELKRLASSFGIGIIKLDLSDIGASEVFYPAKFRDSLDWETINKLCELNPDFKKFIHDVKTDFEGKRIYKEIYDPVIKDIDSYIRDVLKTNQTDCK